MAANQPNGFARYLVAVLSIGAVTVVLSLFSSHINPTTVALAFLLVVLFNAARWGSRPAIVASVLGVLLFNFFFLPPTGTFTINGSDNWVALTAFLITAATAGQLSARARQRAEEAESGRREIERLYKELQDAFERASHTEALRRSELLKSSLLDAVTHDLRTPLTSIKASVTTLLEELRTKPEEAVTMDAEGLREMLEVIDEETDRLNRFIEGLVELARIEAGEMHLHRRLGAVVVTDLSMPNMDGLELCRRLRALSPVPIIVLSVKGEEQTKVDALDAGADDYVTKPFGMNELLARIRAALRRVRELHNINSDSTLLEAGDFRINLETRSVTVRNRELHLTPKEYDLLTYLIRHPGKVITHHALLGALWGSHSLEQTEYLRVFIGQLRKKIEPDPSTPRYILTEPWIGYRFNTGG